MPASGVQSIEVADFNGDDISDLAVTKTFNAQSSVVLFLGAGDGTFPRSTPPKATLFSASTVIGDFNGDSVPDLAALDLRNNTVGVLLGEQNILGAIHGIVLSTPGTHTISATYSGSSTFAGSRARLSISIFPNLRLLPLQRTIEIAAAELRFPTSTELQCYSLENAASAAHKDSV